MVVRAGSPRAGNEKLLTYSIEVGLASLLSYWAATRIWSSTHQPYENGQLGGMWAAISTIFVVRECKRKSVTVAISRMSATLISFILCLVYLAFLPFQAWGLALLVGLSVLVPGLVGRPGDEATAAITTTVVMVVAGLNPHGAWKQPLLRLADTSIGVAAGIVTLVIVNQIGKWTGRDRISQPDRSATSHAD
ncbi:FUSC family protein [Streptomyces sp. NPDC005969]|uniref:FUSC family protein n=1 Tax=Streptomyces sp. NPDC005969 TaxID=3156722 RepID=UPI0034118629